MFSFEFPVDCLVGEIVSIRKKSSNRNEIVFHVDNVYGNSSVYGQNNSNFVSCVLKNEEVKFFHKVLNNVFNYYLSEFDPEQEVSLYNKDQNDDLAYFNDLKLIKDGIVVKIDGEIGNKIFDKYGTLKFAGFVFMNHFLHDSFDDEKFNKINMDVNVKETLISQNIFNFLIPVGNLKKNSLLLKNAVNVFK